MSQKLPPEIQDALAEYVMWSGRAAHCQCIEPVCAHVVIADKGYASLTALLESRMKDSERLDWIIKHADLIATGDPGEFYYTGWTQGNGEDEASFGVRGRGKTPRDAIDATMNRALSGESSQ